MRVGVNMPLLDSEGHPLDAEGIGRRARAIEAAGLDGIWLGDSFSPRMTRPDPLMWLLVGAAATERVEVGTCIFIVPLRNPIELSQRLLTLAAIVAGRFTFGVGSGSTESNYQVFGKDFEGRFRELHEDLQTIRALCRGEAVGLADLNPWPSVVGGPPIVIGAWHSGIWLKRAAAEYDGWMCSAGRTNYATMREGIKRYRDLGGRRAMISTCMFDFSAESGRLADDEPFHLRCGPDEAADRLGRVSELGFDDILLVKADHTRRHAIYEADFADGDLEQIRALLPADTRPPYS